MYDSNNTIRKSEAWGNILNTYHTSQVSSIRTSLWMRFNIPRRYHIDDSCNDDQLWSPGLFDYGQNSMGIVNQIETFMRPTWGPPGSCLPQICWPHGPCCQGKHAVQMSSYTGSPLGGGRTCRGYNWATYPNKLYYHIPGFSGKSHLTMDTSLFLVVVGTALRRKGRIRW